jgi:copper chaperone NosL
MCPFPPEPPDPGPDRPVLGRREVVRRLVLAPFALALAPLAACGPAGPRAIRIGEEECAHCRMRISEERFAAQLLSDRGRSWTFDSIECMVRWTGDGAELPEDRVAGWWVTDFEAPGRWLDATRAAYLRSDGLRSPMGLGLSAYAAAPAARAQQGAHGGDVLDWAGVRALVAGADGGMVGHGR